MTADKGSLGGKDLRLLLWLLLGWGLANESLRLGCPLKGGDCGQLLSDGLGDLHSLLLREPNTLWLLLDGIVVQSGILQLVLDAALEDLLLVLLGQLLLHNLLLDVLWDDGLLSVRVVELLLLLRPLRLVVQGSDAERVLRRLRWQWNVELLRAGSSLGGREELLPV